MKIEKFISIIIIIFIVLIIDINIINVLKLFEIYFSCELAKPFGLNFSNRLIDCDFL